MVSRQLWAAVLFLLGTGLACAAPEGLPRDASGRFGLEIRAGVPLDEALQELARQSGAQLVFFSQITAGRSAPALTGEYTVAAALIDLLDGSGLTFRQVNERTFQVTPGSPRSAGPQGSSGKRLDRRRETAPHASPEAMAEVEVIATVEQLVATRIPTPLQEIPQSLSVISAEQIRQQNSFELGDVLRSAPGLATRRQDSLDESAYSRAYRISSYHVDGGGALKPSLNTVALYAGSPDMGEFDRVEVLRGSDTLFTSNSYAGGAVSLVRKRPLATPTLRTSATVGSWNNYRVELDATGALVDDGSLRARTDVVYANRDYFFDSAHLERKKIFAAIEYDFTPTATLTAGGSYQRDDTLPVANALPLYSDGSDPHLPRDTALTVDWAFYDTRTSNAYLQYRQRFGNAWNLRINASASRTTVAYALADFGARLDKRTDTIPAPSAYFNVRPDPIMLRTADVTLTGALDWLGMHEVVSIGGDYTRTTRRSNLAAFTIFGGLVRDVLNFDPAAYPDPRAIREPDLTIDSRDIEELYGAFASLQVDLGAWSVTGGARVGGNWDRSTGTVRISTFEFPDLRVEFGSSRVITPYAALLYRINQNLSWYGSFADVYRSQRGRMERADGTLVGPEHGVNVETGLKGVWRDGTLNASLVAYDIAQRNAVIQDPSVPPSQNCCYLGVTGHSRGAELEVDGAFGSGWLIGSGYTYNLNEAPDRGIPTTSTPRHLLKIWTSKRLPEAWARWTVGGALRAQTPARGNLFFSCSVQLQTCTGEEATGMRAYAVLDLRAGFDIDPNWRVALSVNNVLDKRYYLSQSTPAQSVWYGEPRNFMFRIDAEF